MTWGDKYIQGVRSDRVPEELWIEIRNIVQEAETKTIPKKKKCKKTKWLSEEDLQIAEKEVKWKAKEKGKDIPNWMQSSREQQGKIRRPASMNSAKVVEENKEKERLEISSR